MKKSLAFIALISSLLLTGCNNAVEQTAKYVVVEENGIPTVYAPGEGTHTTYLMMSRYGYLEIDGAVTNGVTVPEKFYEYCIAWKTSPDGLLPTADQVKSYVDGATFRGWAQYNGNTYPEYLTEVPSVSGQAVYAIFDGTNAGGGGGGGGGGTTPVDAYDVTFNVDLTIFTGWEGIENFSLYVWGENGEEPLGKWDACAGNLVGTENIRSVSVSNITYRIVGAVFYFEQTGGEFPGKKQTTNMSINISTSGTYKIAPTSSTIEWNDEGKMSNFTISKVS